MKRIVICAMLACSLLALALAGCSGSGNSSASSKIDEETLLGVWATESDSGLGFDAYLEFDEDGYAAYIVGDSWYDATWTLTDGKAQLAITQYSMDDYVIDMEDELEAEASAAAESSSAAASASSESASASAASASPEATSKDESGQSEAEEVQVQTITLTYSGGKLVIGSSEGSKLVFAKTDSESVWSMLGLEIGDDIQAIEVVDEVIEDISPVTLADESGYSVVVTGKGTDFTADPGYRLSLTNKGDKDIYITVEDDFKVAGKTIMPGLDETVKAGETLDVFMFFDKDELGGSVEALTDVSGNILVLDDATGDKLATVVFKMD